MISVAYIKKVEDMEIVCHFLPYCLLYLFLNVFWDFGYFTVVDSP